MAKSIHPNSGSSSVNKGASLTTVVSALHLAQQIVSQPKKQKFK